MSLTYRRQLLALLGTGVAVLAGCSSTDDSARDDDDEPVGDGEDDTDDAGGDDSLVDGSSILEDGERPAYASVLPSRDAYTSGDAAPEYFFTAVDLETLLGTIDDDPGEGSVPDDPLLKNPIAAVSLGIYGLFTLGVSPVAQAQATAEGQSDDATLLYLDGAYIFYGEYDREAARTTLADEGYDLVAGGDGEGYDVFTDDTSSEVVGITTEVFVYTFGDDERGRDVVSAIVETAAGERTANADDDETFDALLGANPDGGITTYLYGGGEGLTDLEADQVDADDVAFDFGAFEGSTGLNQRLEADAGESTVRAVVTYESENAVDVDRLESRLGEAASTVDVEAGGSVAVVTAVYTEDVIDE
ncbi:hypothetical protein [Natronosalvus vescus]|uniref:hypothetical protein n=1 Tax=Natronosalvus vescus TaxID=2953881 RepID=UPI0020905E43|nr:hypothetical protein [Natronosalvus vescus]